MSSLLCVWSLEPWKQDHYYQKAHHPFEVWGKAKKKDFKKKTDSKSKGAVSFIQRLLSRYCCHRDKKHVQHVVISAHSALSQHSLMHTNDFLPTSSWNVKETFLRQNFMPFKFYIFYLLKQVKHGGLFSNKDNIISQRIQTSWVIWGIISEKCIKAVTSVVYSKMAKLQVEFFSLISFLWVLTVF